MELKQLQLSRNEGISQVELYDGDKKIGYVSYGISGDTINLTYIYVDPMYRGQGLTTKLMDYVIDFIRENNLKAVPICPVIGRVIQKPKYRDVLK